MDELLTLPQVAKMLGLAERTIYVWSQEGKLPAFKLGTAWRYRADEIDAWVELQRTAGSQLLKLPYLLILPPPSVTVFVDGNPVLLLSS